MNRSHLSCCPSIEGLRAGTGGLGGFEAHPKDTLEGLDMYAARQAPAERSALLTDRNRAR